MAICASCAPVVARRSSLAEGGKYYQALERVDGKLVPSGLKMKLGVQRVHAAEKRPDGVYVCLDEEGDCKSDEYAYDAMCGSMKQGKAGRDGARRVRSGHVLSGGAKSKVSALEISRFYTYFILFKNVVTHVVYLLCLCKLRLVAPPHRFRSARIRNLSPCYLGCLAQIKARLDGGRSRSTPRDRAGVDGTTSPRTRPSH